VEQFYILVDLGVYYILRLILFEFSDIAIKKL